MYILASEVKNDLKMYCQKYKVGKLINKKWIEEANLAQSVEINANSVVQPVTVETEVANGK